mmetsp:Transcript_6762/g.7562  ORF Transcript_6762/g.7562 Transcript_6762/m.7562 type:complete len:134 (+) Transcript_6762:149-550(+)
MQESLKKFVLQNQDPEDALNNSLQKKHKVFKGKIKTNPVNSSQLNSHFITKYLNKLKKNVEDFDMYDVRQKMVPVRTPITPNKNNGRNRLISLDISKEEEEHEVKFDLPPPKKTNYSTIRFRGQNQSPLSKYL